MYCTNLLLLTTQQILHQNFCSLMTDLITLYKLHNYWRSRHPSIEAQKDKLKVGALSVFLQPYPLLFIYSQQVSSPSSIIIYCHHHPHPCLCLNGTFLVVLNWPETEHIFLGFHFLIASFMLWVAVFHHLHALNFFQIHCWLCH